MGDNRNIDLADGYGDSVLALLALSTPWNSTFSPGYILYPLAVFTMGWVTWIRSFGILLDSAETDWKIAQGLKRIENHIRYLFRLHVYEVDTRAHVQGVFVKTPIRILTQWNFVFLSHLPPSHITKFSLQEKRKKRPPRERVYSRK